MVDTLIPIIAWISAISMGVMSGVYFTFSAFVMRSLDAQPAATAIEAMNAINQVILRSAFMPLFFGSTLLSLVLVVTGLIYPESGAGYDGTPPA